MPRAELRLVYTVTEAAEPLGLSRSTAYHLVATGEPPTIRLGRRLAVTRPAMTELLGLEPPLPHELEIARRAVAAPAPVRRPERSPARQPDLPFRSDWMCTEVEEGACRPGGGNAARPVPEGG